MEDAITKWSGSLQGAGGEIEGKFKAVCVSCQKETLVPFEPREGLPVYCRDCMKKIKAGELQPVRGFVNPSAEKRKEASRSPLAALGIEFTENNTQKIVEKGQNTPIRGGFDNRKKTIMPNKSLNNDKPQFIERKKSGPSPMLKGLLKNIGLGKKDDIQKIEDLPIEEIKKEIPTAMSLSSLKNADSPNTIKKEEKIEMPKITKEASAEHLNSLKDMLSNIPKKEEPVQKIEIPVKPISTPTPDPVFVASIPIPTPTPTLDSTLAPIPEKEEVVNSDDKWKKRVPQKEVPEDVLKKVLE